MSSEKIIVFIKIIGNSSPLSSNIKRLNPDDSLSDIRKELENYNIINDMLLFSKEDNNEFSREEEETFQLREIIKIDDDRNILYLKQHYWKILNNQCKLDYGRIMSFDGIKIAKKQAYTMIDCELNEINSYKKGRLEFESKDDWMKKTNLFFDVDGINITNLGSSAESLRNKSIVMSAYKYIEIEKLSLKLSKANLKLTKEFEKDVNDAINSKNPENFKKIVEEYGRFIPTEISMGGRVYFNDVNDNSENMSIESSINSIGHNSSYSEITSEFYKFNHMKLLGGKNPDDEYFDEKKWNESLKEYQNWECIGFKSPVNIFQLLPDDLREETFKSIGKKILYTNTEDFDYYLNEPGRYQTFELKNIPQNILEIIQDEKADCDIFASVFDNNENSRSDLFCCKILREPNTKPSIIIHCMQKEFKPWRYNLKIMIMIIGYDTDFNFMLQDIISVELIKNEYKPQNNHEFHRIPLQQKLSSMMSSGVPFFGIPILSNLDSSNNSIIIGHNFCNTQSRKNKFNIDVYSYCLKKKRYDKLPQFTFCTLFISDYPDTPNSYKSLPFNFRFLGNNPFIKFSFDSLNPKCVSLYSSKNNNYRPMFVNQKINQIKIEYVHCSCKKTCFICKNKTVKISKENNVKCILFDHNVI
ncbi:hypothetical protein RclHR1_09510002 [Rhizophagus clarus]|uniref:MACPF domain-containing protein n=1 Tax=Rhizophagus clarus TaxID=94130 RepID=A0A2Z6S6U2_9GLOM|nr:hypothetical protein RclHR1_09510002 [Rhizophagus clarus]GES80277.1 hypothetical protein GLOIN_2v1484896 [Rhizophagus clarus]